DGTAVNYTFDPADRLQSLVDWASRSTSYSYFPDSRVQAQTNFNSTNASYTFDKRPPPEPGVEPGGANTISQHTYTLANVGDRTPTPNGTPRVVKGVGGSGTLTGMTAVAGGDAHSLALSSTGTVYAWGSNAFGQLGDGTTTDHLYPTAVPNLSGVTQVGGGD